ncbi:unnamed protein product, partial [Brenthis ino]
MSWEYKRALSAKLKSRFKHREGLNNDSKTNKRRNTREKTTATERQRLEKNKNDPVLRANQQEKERQKYLTKKSKGIILPIGEMSPR